jgi:LCP family protein required for cell wall assembly
MDPQIEDRKNKINTAYGKGGAPLLVETVERNTGLHIDHYMEVGFKGIRDITDAVGGVNMCVPADVTDENSGLSLLLAAKSWMARMRWRMYVCVMRIQRVTLDELNDSNSILSSVMKKVATPAVLVNPFSMWNLVDAGTDSVNVGAEGFCC